MKSTYSQAIRKYKLIQEDLNDIWARINPKYEGDLTHQFIRGMLVSVRRLKTHLEVLDAELENEQDG